MAVSTVTLGGKGSTLSSASVYAIAHNLSKVRIDSSILEKLSSNTHPLSSSKQQLQIRNPSFLTTEEVSEVSEVSRASLTTEVSRASLVVLLNKLLITQTGIRPVLPLLISETLNQELSLESLDLGSTLLGFLKSFFSLNGTTLEETGVTDGELVVLDNSFAALNGICALLDCSSSALSNVADALAALSCEASGADVSLVQNLSDSGDGLSIKDETAVAGDMKVLLAGSKLVGRVQSEAISDIPKVNGSFREVVRLVHSRTRVELNSSVKVGKAGTGSSVGTANALVTAFSPLATSLLFLGETSLLRARLTVESIQDDVDFRLRVLEMFEYSFPSFGSLRDGFRVVQDAAFEANYIRFLLEIYNLVVRVREILAWEGALALLLIERSESKEKNQKKKKVVLGKGTTVIKQLIKDRLQNKGGESVDDFTSLNYWIRDLSLFFEPKDPELDAFLGKLKEIVESNESRRLPKLPKGTRDFSKEQMASREKAFSIIQEVFKRHGAMALDTPVFEMRETLMGKYGEDSKLIYDLADQGGELCSLRYDLTVPFARYLAMNGITSFKRYQMAKVYRRDNPSRGRFREFYQCDFDIAGQHEAMGPDFEVVKVLTELLDELNINDYQIKLNHRKLLDGMLEICGVSTEKFRTICSSIDKLDKQSFEEIKKEMVEEKGLTVETADRIGTFVKKRGSAFEILSELKQEGSQFLENSGSVLALKDLETLFTALEKSKCINRVVFDLSLARGLDYYTGVIFEAVYTGTAIEEIGSIAAGGRYDNLVGMFGSKDIPAVGASLGIERIFSITEALEKQRGQVVRATETQVLVSILGNDLSQAAELVSELWGAKLKAEYMLHKKLLKHFERAEKSLIPLVVMVGEREVSEGVVRIRDYTNNKKEDVVPRNEVVKELQKRLNILPQ